MSLNHKRVAYNIVIVLSLLFFPWWVSVSLLLAGFFFFRFWIESMVGALVIDTLFTPPQDSFFQAFAFTLSALAVFLVSWYLRERVFLPRG